MAHTLGTLEAKYTVGTVAELTGITPHTLRAWERRYATLLPGRTETNRRLYSDADVHRLRLLKHLIDGGHTIGRIANLSAHELERLASSRIATPLPPSEPPRTSPDPLFEAARAALAALDEDALLDSLHRAAARLGIVGALDRVAIPLIRYVEERWNHRDLAIYQEHFATAVVRTYLDRARAATSAPPDSPRLIVTTPVRQLHELGALMVALVAAVQSWNVTYLGPNLPAHEIARAARDMGADAIGLSLVFPLDDQELAHDLLELRRLVGPAVPIFAGGRGAVAYSDTLTRIGAHRVHAFAEFQSALDELANSLPRR